MPTPSSMTSGSAGTKNTELKYGGPTEILPRSKASISNGQSSPTRIRPAAATSSALLSSRNDSRDTSAKPPSDFSVGARTAYSVSEPTMKNSSSASMKRPRDGSEANECTDTSTPERTRKVPSRLRLKAKIASSSVQLLNRPRFSVTASE